MSGDKIRLDGMVFYGYHGVSPAERELGQRFVVDLEVERDLSAAAASDDPKVREVVEGPGRKLLEGVAEEVARRILNEFNVDSVRVRVKKPHVPMRGAVLDHAAVEIFREPER